MKFMDNTGIYMEGHVKIKEFLTMEDRELDNPCRILLDKRNSVNPENLSIVIARGLSNQNNGSIYSMAFGTGGATIDNAGNIQYATPNTLGNASLNNQVYFKVVNDNSALTNNNIIIIRHINGVSFSDVEIHCVLGKNEPYGQIATDSTGPTSTSTQFTFNEIGLKSADGLLLTHITFNPILKSSNRIFEVVYTIRCNVN